MALKGARGQGSSPIGQVSIRGKASWFGGPNDHSDSGHTANGMTTATPGIAVYNQQTLGGYWKVTAPNGRSRVIQQTDIGPAPRTGRIIDFTYSALSLFGYAEGNFPTDRVASAVYLGKNKRAAIERGGGDAIVSAQSVTSGGEVGASPGNGGTMQNASLLGEITGDATSVLSLLQDLVSGNVGDLGAKMGLMGLTLVKDISIGFVDLIIAPGWHWNQRAAAYYSTYILDPRRIANDPDYQWAFAWTAAFWGLGYALLFTNDEDGVRHVSPVHRSRLASHVRRLQALPARKSLVKPKDVKRHTPTKPPVKVSRASVTQRGTMSTTRPRSVKVHASGIPPKPAAQPETTSEVPITDTQDARFQHKEIGGVTFRKPEPHKAPTGRQRAPVPKRSPPARPPGKGRRNGRRS